ncbi:OmpP1/FadL family transporter [Salinibacter grassmerensis]|uniref:OmpP1/FadL family transporter n=1 Tax=Salinibacter grassmerensis TaxID=3040353 RepID=UPI0021E7B1A7|nr:outer membrane protein transport protein [Salinibacter grassmerensis]
MLLPRLRALYLTLAMFVVAGLWAPSLVQAQGFGVYEQGSCAMARAGATVANGCGDGSSIYFNPANVAGAEGVTASVGATLIDANGEFTYDYTVRAPYTGTEVSLQNDPIPVPHGYVTYGLSERAGVGVGLYVPYGLETNWPTQLSDGTYFDGAFEGSRSRIQNIYVQPTTAYQITPRLRVGSGPIFAISVVELNQLLDLSQQSTPDGPTFGQLGIPFHTAFARVELESSNELGIGANFGLSYQATDRISIGARFTTPITVSYEGTAEFEQIQTELTVPADIVRDGEVVIPAGKDIDDIVGPQFQPGQQSENDQDRLTEQRVETEITFPLQLVGGLSVQATGRLLLLADYQFTGWSSFDEIALDFENLGERVREENYDDTHALRLGAEYDVLEQLTARLGYLYNTAAAPDETVTPLLPESNRNQFTVGIGWRPTDTIELNASYQLLQQNDRRGRVRGTLPGESLSTDLNQGLYGFGANLFGTTLTLHL